MDPCHDGLMPGLWDRDSSAFKALSVVCAASAGRTWTLDDMIDDTLLADRPRLRMEVEALARRCRSWFVLVRV